MNRAEGAFLMEMLVDCQAPVKGRLFFQRFGRKIFHQQDMGLDAEGFCDLIKPIDGDTIFLTLQRTDVGPINHRGICQCFLRQASRGAKNAQILGESFSAGHHPC